LQGCKSTDTLKVLQVYNNPVVMLNHNDKLCQGNTKILDAGAFSTWRWQNGAATRTLAVNNTGVYYVDVTDNHGCKGSDTSYINTILPLPVNFLPVGVSKCNYEKISVKPNYTYQAYLWSTNSTASAITISNPGLYWLAVTDKDGCTGRDSIVITQRQCLKGLFVPTAFTPNTDGTNDLLKALLFGAVKIFGFKIFNRYGQLVFYTADVNAGWNGKYKGEKQEYGTYVWQCRYQLEGEDVKEECGSFVLLR
jgi:gliding motility-associated-like protein